MKFILKWLINGAIVIILLMNYADVSFGEALLTATVLTLIAYFVGDQLILRTTNNTVATISDAILAYVILSIAAYQMDWDLRAGEILTTAVVIGIAEWFIHRYVLQSRYPAAQAR